jgi:hypothetical protein
MVYWFAGAGFQWEATGDLLAIGSVYRVKDGFFECIGVDEGGKGGSGGGDGHSTAGGVGMDLDRQLLGFCDGGGKGKHNYYLTKTFSKIVGGKVIHITGVCVSNNLN